ncbi:hypothetical protein PMIN06_000120 [Paraphaeosphaeria minitans]
MFKSTDYRSRQDRKRSVHLCLLAAERDSNFTISIPLAAFSLGALQKACFGLRLRCIIMGFELFGKERKDNKVTIAYHGFLSLLISFGLFARWRGVTRTECWDLEGVDMCSPSD